MPNVAAIKRGQSGKSGKGMMKKMADRIKKIVNKGKVAKGKVTATTTAKETIIAPPSKEVDFNIVSA